jgi:hypothetical protein
MHYAYFTSNTEIWSPIEKVSDIRKNSALVRTLKGRQLKLLANVAMEMIERESHINRILNQLVDVIQLDDPLSQSVDLMECAPEGMVREFREVVQVGWLI